MVGKTWDVNSGHQRQQGVAQGNVCVCSNVAHLNVVEELHRLHIQVSYNVELNSYSSPVQMCHFSLLLLWQNG